MLAPITLDLRSMASIRKVGDSWRAEVRRRGVYASESFPTKAAANRWALEQENAIEEARAGKVPRKTLREALERYARDETPKKRGWRSEGIRITKFIATIPFVDRWFADVTADDWAQWRDALAKGSFERRPLAPGSVIRDMNIIRAMHTVALEEWGWLKVNVLKSVKSPPRPQGRKRVIHPKEVTELCDALGYVDGTPISTKSQRTAAGLLIALETGMRAGEVFSLTAKHVDTAARVAHLPMTKNGEARDVPLSKRAVQLLEAVDLELGVSAASADALFRKYRPKHLADVHFHDTRHTAATRLGASGKLTPFELCRMFGWTDMKQALLYFNATAAQIATKLD